MPDLRRLGPAEVADAAMSWPVVAHRVLGSGRVSDFVDDQVATPAGDTMARQYLLHPGAVGVIAWDEKDRIVVVRQYRHPVGFRLTEPPAGLLDHADEDPLLAVQRELAEETGYGGGQWRELMVVAPNPSTQNNLTYCYLATGVERLGEQHLDATEDIRVHLFSGAEVRDLLESGRIRQALMAAPLWRYAAEYGL